MMTVLGAIVGSYVWWRRPQSRLNPEEYIQYKAMLIRFVFSGQPHSIHIGYEAHFPSGQSQRPYAQ